MKIIKIILSSFIISFLPFFNITGQEKKIEKKIKVIVDDKSGTKVIIDTVFNDEASIDSIRLKDGNVVYIGKHRNPDMNFPGHREGHFIVRVPEDKDFDNEMDEITVIASDSVESADQPGAGGKVYVYSNSVNHEGRSGKRFKVVKNIERSGKSSGDQYVYVNDDNGKRHIYRGERVEINTDGDGDENDNDIDKTRYVIAKNGVVVTIEGDNDAVIRNLVREVEKQLDVNKEVKTAKPVDKEVETKTVKKK